jgi:[ribosomal protein S5]-alanine N-acetyltransferase
VASSPRLWLIRPPTEVLRARVHPDDVEAEVLIDARRVRVLFPSTWPGDALPLVANWLETRRIDARGEPWGGTLVERDGARAIGTMGCKSWPDADGTVEVGYGLEPSRRRRGLATEGLRALLRVLDAEESVRRVIAETLEDNLASQAVLRRCGFSVVGEAMSDEGPMIWWERPSPAPGKGDEPDA